MRLKLSRQLPRPPPFVHECRRQPGMLRFLRHRIGILSTVRAETAMNENDETAGRGTDIELFRKVSERLIDLVVSIPMSGENAATDPRTRARALVSSAALKSATISGSLALPPGPLGLITILPDLYAIWEDPSAACSRHRCCLWQDRLSNARDDVVLPFQTCRSASRPRSDCSSWRKSLNQDTHAARLTADLGEGRCEDDAARPWARRLQVGADSWSPWGRRLRLLRHQRGWADCDGSFQ